MSDPNPSAALDRSDVRVRDDRGVGGTVRAFVDRQYAACMDKQRAFDHGQKATVAGLAFVRAAQAAGLPAGKGF